MNDKNQNITKKVEFDYGVIELVDDILIYRPSLELNTYTMPHVKSLTENMLKLAKGKTKPCLFDNSTINQAPSEKVKQYTYENLGKFASTCAVIENSSLTRFLVNSFIYLYRPETTIKMFKNEGDAIKWLKQKN